MIHRFLALLALSLLGPLGAAAQTEPQTDSTAQIQAVTIERPPFAMRGEDGLWTGFSIDLMRAAAAEMGAEVVFQEASVFTDMLASVEAGEVDLAIANISITSAREETMDFSLPIFNSGLRILTTAEAGSPSLIMLIWRSGAPMLILLAVAILITAAHLMWFFERGGHPYFRKAYPAGVWDALWWAFVIATMGGFEKERPRRLMGRAFAMLWIVAALFFISSFTAMITSAMTVGRLETGIRDHRDLRGKVVGIPVGTTQEDFARRNGVAYRPYDDLNTAIRAVERGDIDATMGDAPVLDYYALNEGAGKVTPVGDVFAPDRLGAAFPPGSELREAFNLALLRLIENGFYDDLKTQWFSE